MIPVESFAGLKALVPRLLARLVLAFMLVMGQGLAGQNRASANFSVPDTCIGAQTAYNQLSSQGNLPSEGQSHVGDASFGQVANTVAGTIIKQNGWSEDSTQAVLLHGLVGVAQAAISGGGSAGTMAAGGVGAVAGTAITPLLANYLEENGVPKGSAEENMLLSLASSAIGAGTGALADGGSAAAGATAGASTAGASTLYNETNGEEEKKLAELECEVNPDCNEPALAANLNAGMSLNEAMGLADSINPAGTKVVAAAASGNTNPIAFAQSQQGNAKYPGVDDYSAITLLPGSTIYQLGDKTDGSVPGNFFDYNGESLLTAPSGTAAANDLQVQIDPTYGPYQGYTTFQVTSPIPGAVGTVNANPLLGSGGATQIVIDSSAYNSCLVAVCYTDFPGGAGTTK